MYFRVLLLAAFALSTLLSSAQQVTIKVPNCEEAIYQFRFNGVTFVKTNPLEKQADGTFTLANDVALTGITYVGPASGSPIPIVLDGKESFNISGNCRKMSAAIMTGSPVNDAYGDLKRTFQGLNQKGQNLTRSLSVTKSETPAYEAAKQSLKENDDQKVATLESLRTEGADFFASVMAVNLYTSFANSEKPYTNELMYYVNERFQYTDFSKPIYAGNPWVFESYRDFTKTLLQAKVPAQMLEESLNTQLDLVYNNRPVHKLALGGVIATLKIANSPMTATFAKQYLKRYAEEEPESVSSLQSDITRLTAFEDGAVAPSFTQMTLDSSGMVGPENYRGKILLIDFWASWCGPCRKENPNVVKMYNKHKDQGFDILGVSLDKQHNRWAGAVKKDNLQWTHVSDLRGWQNAVAQQYGVRSIPATVLLDREGRIVARNLRGPALEAKVAELLEKG